MPDTSVEAALARWRQQVLDDAGRLLQAETSALHETLLRAVRAEAELERERLCGQLRRELTTQWNELSRRLRAAETMESWRQVFLDGAVQLCGKVALFQVSDAGALLEAARGGFDPAVEARLREQRLALADSPAFGQCRETKDTVVTLRAPRQLGPVADLYPDGGNRAHLFPLLREGKVVGVLLAVGAEQPLELPACELLAALGSEGLSQRAPARQAAAGLLGLAPAAPAAPPDEHLRAQRWAAAQVSQILLKETAAVQAGRAARTLYSVLREAIETARAAYRQQFMETGVRADYLHAELVRTLANGNESALGPEYPGPLA